MSEKQPLIFRPRKVSLEIRILAWVFILLIPLVGLRMAFKAVLDRDGKSHLQILQRDLMNEMESFLQDCKLESFIERTLARIEEKLGFPPPQGSRQYLFYKGSASPFAAGDLANALTRDIRKKTGVTPLFIFATGPDGKDVEIRADPARFSPVEVPGKKNVQAFLWSLSGLPARHPWIDPVFLADLARRFGGDVGLEKLRKDVTRFGKIFLGTYAALLGNPSQCRGFFTHRFGGERVILYHRLVTAKETPDSPLLAGYCVAFLESDFPLPGLLRRVSREKGPGGLPRFFGLKRGKPEADFHRGSRGLSYFHPVPQEMLNLGSLQGRSFIQRSVAGRGKLTEDRHPFLEVRMPPAHLDHPLGRFFPSLDGGLALFLSLTFLLALRGGDIGLLRSLDIRRKLVLAIGVAIGLPLVTFWLLAVAYWNFHSRLEVKKELLRMSDRLELIEMSVKRYNFSRRVSLWKWREELSRNLHRSGEVLEKILDLVLKEGGIDALHLFRYDGSGFTRVLEAGSGTAGKGTLDSAFLMNGFGYVFLKAAGSLAGNADSILRKRPEGKTSLVIADTINAEQTDQMYRDQGEPLTLQFIGKQDAQFNFILIPMASSSSPVPGAVLFSRESFLMMIENFFRKADDQAAIFSEESGPFFIRSAVYPMAGQAGDDHSASLGWPKEQAKDAALAQIARLAQESGREGSWSDFSRGYPELFAIRKFMDLPFIVVSQGIYRGEFFGVFGATGFVLYVLLFSAGLIFLLAYLLSRVFIHPIRDLVFASTRIRDGDLEAETGIDTGDEFAVMGGEFNRMARGLRERRRLSRFVSEEAVLSVSGEVLSSETIGGTKVRRTILFSHIRQFSSLAERRNPEMIVDLLNQYFGELEGIIRRNHGSIDKYIGDAVMAVFSSLPGEAHEALRAMRTAWEIRDMVRAFNETRRRSGLFEIETGFGLATGEMISGYIGSLEGRRALTVIGDTVNLAARLESMSELAKESGIILCSQTASSAGPEFHCRSLGEVLLKGKAHRIPAFELLRNGET